MAEVIYVGDDQVGVQFDERGPIVTLDRDGRIEQRFTPPPDALVLMPDGADVEAFARRTRAAALDEVARRARNRGLSENTIRVLTEQETS